MPIHANGGGKTGIETRGVIATTDCSIVNITNNIKTSNIRIELTRFRVFMSAGIANHNHYNHHLKRILSHLKFQPPRTRTGAHVSMLILLAMSVRVCFMKTRPISIALIYLS